MKVISMLTTTRPAKGAVRVAFATTDGVNVNDHFGWATHFSLYDVTTKGFVKAGKIVFDGTELSERGNDDKLAAKIEALIDCHLIYSVAIGGPAAARLSRAKIQPMVVRDDNSVESILKQLTDVVKGPTPPWLRKIMKTEDPSRFDQWDEEEESE